MPLERQTHAVEVLVLRSNRIDCNTKSSLLLSCLRCGLPRSCRARLPGRRSGLRGGGFSGGLGPLRCHNLVRAVLGAQEERPQAVVQSLQPVIR